MGHVRWRRVAGWLGVAGGVAMLLAVVAGPFASWELGLAASWPFRIADVVFLALAIAVPVVAGVALLRGSHRAVLVGTGVLVAFGLAAVAGLVADLVWIITGEFGPARIGPDVVVGALLVAAGLAGLAALVTDPDVSLVPIQRQASRPERQMLVVAAVVLVIASVAPTWSVPADAFPFPMEPGSWDWMIEAPLAIHAYRIVLVAVVIVLGYVAAALRPTVAGIGVGVGIVLNEAMTFASNALSGLRAALTDELVVGEPTAWFWIHGLALAALVVILVRIARGGQLEEVDPGTRRLV